ncbi:hypothetical protein JD844_008385 [Phrynosoma platyrhinos]|uniref:PDZ domain-containing protein n=1 Tax=Phrynosoma platyrhinos TaxID=52577 RepID=A0ABQ7TEK6_PHRPL|nr:hypothetical protein JD844_008385 [Phrynosoma platyrhinos]
MVAPWDVVGRSVGPSGRLDKPGQLLVGARLPSGLGVAEHSRGDQILEADSVSLRHAALSEAYAILRERGPGPVHLIISRHPNPKVSEQEMDEAITQTTQKEHKDVSSSHCTGQGTNVLPEESTQENSEVVNWHLNRDSDETEEIGVGSVLEESQLNLEEEEIEEET